MISHFSHFSHFLFPVLFLLFLLFPVQSCCFSILLGFISPVALWIFQKRLILPEAIYGDLFQIGGFENLDGFGPLDNSSQSDFRCLQLACVWLVLSVSTRMSILKTRTDKSACLIPSMFGSAKTQSRNRMMMVKERFGRHGGSLSVPLCRSTIRNDRRFPNSFSIRFRKHVEMLNYVCDL